MSTHLPSPPKALPFYAAFFYSLLNLMVVYAQAPTITTLGPLRNAVSAPRSSNVSVTFSQAMNAATASNSAMRVYGSQTGARTLAGKGSFSGGGTNTVRFDPNVDFKPGEQVSVSVTANAKSTGGTALAKPQGYSFKAATAPAPATFTRTSPVTSYYVQTDYAFQTADFDQDGDLDIVNSSAEFSENSENRNGVFISYNDGSGQFPTTSKIDFAIGPLVIADLDADGDMDIVVSNPGANNVIFLFNDGSGLQFARQSIPLKSSDSTPPVLADLDLDGDVDLTIPSENIDNKVNILLNDGTGHFSPSSVVSLTSGSGLLSLSDVDNDGDVDMVTTSYGTPSDPNGSYHIDIFLNSGAAFTATSRLAGGNYISSLEIADLNGDGTVDLAVSYYAESSAKMAIWWNNGSGSFPSKTELTTNSDAVTLSLGDFDGNGSLDIISASLDNKLVLALNDGAGHFSPKANAFDAGLTPIVYYAGIKPGDFDGDGDLDVAIDIVDGKNILFNESIGCQASGSIYREVWANVPGKLVSNIPLNTPATLTGQLTSFNTPAGYGDNYGQRIRGYICAPATGAYTFFLQGDDQAELYLSSDDSPTNKVKIITVQGALGWVAQQTPVSLVAGRKYYVEALHKENTGGDFLRVGWRTPLMNADATPLIIPGSVLSPYQNPTLAPTGLSATASATSIGLSWKDVQQESGYVLERATAPSGPFIQLTTLPASSATEVTYSDPFVLEGTTYYYRLYATSLQGATPYSNLASAALPSCTASGSILREVWTNLPGKLVSAIPLNTPATITGQLTSFNTPAGYGDNYGQRIRGYICAPATGAYSFFLQGDDQAQLSLSTDEEAANKAQLLTVQGAQSWVGAPSPVWLVAGKRYYVEALHKENTGGDFLRVGWRTPLMNADATPLIIPGSVLSPFTPPPANGLLACYALSGNANDGSGQGNNGTVYGATLAADRYGRPASAYAFNGNSSHIGLPATRLQAASFSYSLWVKPTALPDPQTYAVPFSIGSYGGDQNVSLLNQYQGNAASSGWQVSSYGAVGPVTSASTGRVPVLDTWYHLVMTRDATSLKLYVNGTLASSASTSTASAYYGSREVTAYIGRRSSTVSQYFQGLIDDVQVYNQALSADEVSSLYHQTGNPCPANAAARLSESVQEEGLVAQLSAYPNPTTGSTTVAFTAVEKGWVGVQLFNQQGQALKQLFGEEVEAGFTHQQSLDASTLPTGLYLLRLVNGPHRATQKLVIVR